MSSSADFIIAHAEHCDKCIEVEERTDLTDDEKWQIQEECAIESCIP